MEKKKSYVPLILFLIAILVGGIFYYWSTHRWMPIVIDRESIASVQIYAVDGSVQVDIPMGTEQEELLDQLENIKIKRMKRAFSITPPYVLAFYDERGKTITQLNFDKVLVEKKGFWQEVRGAELWPILEPYIEDVKTTDD